MEGESCDEQSGDRMLTRSIAIAASLLSGACALQGIAPSPAMAEEGAATCVRYDRDGVCTFWAKRNDTTGGEPGGTKKTQTVTKSATPLPGLRPGAVAPSGQLWSRRACDPTVR